MPVPVGRKVSFSWPSDCSALAAPAAVDTIVSEAVPGAAKGGKPAHAIERNMPPSTRSAASVVADACSEHMQTTILATSSTVARRRISEVGLSLHFVFGHAPLRGEFSKECDRAVGTGRPRQHRALPTSGPEAPRMSKRGTVMLADRADIPAGDELLFATPAVAKVERPDGSIILRSAIPSLKDTRRTGLPKPLPAGLGKASKSKRKSK